MTLPTGLRKAHTKSRNGCGQCKKRRIKCDERTPICSNCQKHRNRCDFQSLEAPRSIITYGTRKSQGTQTVIHKEKTPSAERKDASTSTNASNQICQIPSPDDLNLRHLELMHHYTAMTSLTLSRDLDGSVLWCVDVPKAALVHEFLMHNLLSVSALHIAHLCKSTQPTYDRIARLHHVKALTKFRNSITSIDSVNPENYTAVFSFASMIAIFSGAIALVPDTKEPVELLENFSDIIWTVKRTREFVKSCRAMIETEPIEIYKHRVDGTQMLNPVALITSLDRLYQMNELNTLDETHKSDYRDCMDMLRKLYQTGVVAPASWSLIADFPNFLELMRQKEAMALVIMAHWCVLIHRLPYRWFVGDWGRQLMRGILASIDPSWKPSIKSPLTELGMDWMEIAPMSLMAASYQG